MRWKLFIDDERDPVEDDWIIARSSNAAIDLCGVIGCLPSEIAFDHDLGGDDTSIRFIKWMTESILDGHATLPEDFIYYIHSQNPVGSKNIAYHMNQLIDHAETLT